MTLFYENVADPWVRLISEIFLVFSFIEITTIIYINKVNVVTYVTSHYQLSLNEIFRQTKMLLQITLLSLKTLFFTFNKDISVYKS